MADRAGMIGSRYLGDGAIVPPRRVGCRVGRGAPSPRGE